ncbi:MAG: LPS export ABC transporter periplasmic protein LptC [Bacteroidia bacterium]|nr:MAG: LPS export ABC transporter periplasmic protein LptC [Bacteroidia bacterium]
MGYGGFMQRFYSPRYFRFFIVILLSLLCILLNSVTKINLYKMELPKDKPAYSAYGVVGSVYTKSGKLLYKLSSEEGWRYPDDERIYIKDYQGIIYDESSDLMKYQITGQDGWFNNNTHVAFLDKDIKVVVANKDPLKVATIYGSRIEVALDKKILKSREDVRAFQGKDAVYAHGFSYDDNTKILILESNVKIIYNNLEAKT